MKKAKFITSNLRGVNFELADLSDAVFSDSNLHGATLDGANLANADFSKVKNLSVVQLRSAYGA